MKEQYFYGEVEIEWGQHCDKLAKMRDLYFFEILSLQIQDQERGELVTVSVPGIYRSQFNRFWWNILHSC